MRLYLIFHVCVQSLQAVNERQDIELIGMGIGCDRTFVPSCYQRWLTAAYASALPEAMRAMYEQDSGCRQQPEQDRPWEDLVAVGSSSTAAEVMETFTRVYPELVEKRQKREGGDSAAHLPDAIAVDLVFVLDCSGSMCPWLPQMRRQIKEIADNIVPGVKREFADTRFDLRLGLVAFRDIDDGPHHIFRHGFTTEASELQDVVSGTSVALQQIAMLPGCHEHTYRL